MIVRTWVYILFLMFFAYGAYGVLHQYSAGFYLRDWQFYFYAISPSALLLASIKAWHRSFVWRRMLNQRQIQPALSRGEYRMRKTIYPPTILERGAFLFCLFAIAAIFRQLSIPHIAWWVGSLFVAWYVLRLMLKKLLRF